jgi:hypothetical protein
MFHKKFHSTMKPICSYKDRKQKDQRSQVTLERNDEEWALHESRTAKDEIAQVTEKNY